MPDTESNLPQLIEHLLDPSAYPHPTSPPIKLLQTHISYILLTGEIVYKIKKPVNFGFLNFTTLERRKHFCLEELRLNQRGAPGIYLRVDPISQHGNDFRIGDESNAVEYVVVMKQLPQEGLFSHLLQAGRLNESHILKLARTLAKSHAGAPRVDRGRNLGNPDSIRQTMQENYDHTVPFIGTLQPPEQFQQTRSFTDSQFAKFRDLMESRLDNGFIRECHGDLHLSNVCFWNDKVVLFDCIEFNEPFRCIDVIQDAAFAAMDLQASDRHDLATLFINTYIEQTGDYEGMQLFPLYLCRQAFVRAKINSLLTEEPEVSDEEKQNARETARHYYERASQYAKLRRGPIILISGASGSGKSTVARALADAMQAVYIVRSDAVRKHLAHIPVDQKGGDELYGPRMSELTYARLRELGIKLAMAGETVILDAKYDRRSLRRLVLARSSQLGIPVAIFHCTAPAEVLRERVRNRHGDVSDATADLIERQLGEFQSFDQSESSILTTIDTTQPIDFGALSRKLRSI